MKKNNLRIFAFVIAAIMALSMCACASVDEYVYLGVSDYIINSDSVLRLNATTPQERLDALRKVLEAFSAEKIGSEGAAPAVHKARCLLAEM